MVLNCRGVVLYGMMVGRLPFQIIYDPKATRDDKRKFLMEETKRGLTVKHKKYLMTCSHCKLL